LEPPEQKYRSLEVVLAATRLARLLLQVSEKPFGRKLRLRPKQIVKRRQPFWVIRKVTFVI
jgi:hypothetical protein